MKKYFHIYKATLNESVQYISSVLISFISFFIIMFVFINLWQYVYQDESQLINGYSMNQMIWYVLITEVLWFGTRNKTLTKQISFDIKTGNIAYNINKPYNYVLYMIARHLGEITIKLILFIVFGILLGTVMVGKIPEFNFAYIPLILISIILGILINSVIRITISVISFWIEDSTPFHWIYDKLILVLGTIFPVEMFPKWLQPIIKCTPVLAVTYGPAKLIIDFSFGMFWQIIAVQTIYLVISSSILLVLYKIGTKKLNVNGG
ncbi:MAG: ABC-2 family transporter protein [Clostridia bacterium]|nr:ABC-2 family transporter protein [Clostridia bacterium]